MVPLRNDEKSGTLRAIQACYTDATFQGKSVGVARVMNRNVTVLDVKGIRGASQPRTCEQCEHEFSVRQLGDMLCLESGARRTV